MSKTKQQHRSNIHKLIQEYFDAPNIPQRQFCGLYDIFYSTFQYNLRKRREQQSIKAEKQQPHFVPVTPAENEQAMKTRSACEIAWPNGLVIRFDSTPGLDYLLSLIAAAASRL